jgi:hypothetical protein
MYVFHLLLQWVCVGVVSILIGALVATLTIATKTFGHFKFAFVSAGTVQYT